MADIETTTTTTAGIMERDQADMSALFLSKSRLFKACWSQGTQNASVVQFPSMPAPSAVSAGTEANDVSQTAITIAAKTATINIYPELTHISKLSWKGGTAVPEWIKAILSNDVSAGVDTAIAAEFETFTPQSTGVASLTVFKAAKATLMNSGYIGTPIAVMSEMHWDLVSTDMLGKYHPQTNETLAGAGYVGRYLGVDIITVPEAWLPTSGGTYIGAMFFQEYGIGLGYHNPLVEMTAIEDNFKWKMGAAAYCDPVCLTANGGIELIWTLS